MQLTVKSKKEYNLTVDGETYQLIINSLTWSKFYKNDTIQELDKSFSGVDNTRTILEHEEDVKKLTKLQDQLVSLR